MGDGSTRSGRLSGPSSAVAEAAYSPSAPMTVAVIVQIRNMNRYAEGVPFCVRPRVGRGVAGGFRVVELRPSRDGQFVRRVVRAFHQPAANVVAQGQLGAPGADVEERQPGVGSDGDLPRYGFAALDGRRRRQGEPLAGDSDNR